MNQEAEFDVLDVTLSAVNSDEPRPNVGDKVSDEGVGAAVPMLAADGFVGWPNAPSDAGAARVVVMTLGHQRMVVAADDQRWNGKAGAGAPGDRAIVSNCDAALFLDQSANAISLKSTDVSVVVDGAAGTVTITKGTNVVTIGSSAITASVGGGGKLVLSSLSAELRFGTMIFQVNSTGASLASTGAPAVLSVNGIPVVVP